MSGSTNWIYNNYEFENRVNNMAWTISGMYDEEIDSSEKITHLRMFLYILE